MGRIPFRRGGSGPCFVINLARGEGKSNRPQKIFERTRHGRASREACAECSRSIAGEVAPTSELFGRSLRFHGNRRCGVQNRLYGSVRPDLLVKNQQRRSEDKLGKPWTVGVKLRFRTNRQDAKQRQEKKRERIINQIGPSFFLSLLHLALLGVLAVLSQISIPSRMRSRRRVGSSTNRSPRKPAELAPATFSGKSSMKTQSAGSAPAAAAQAR